MQKKKVLQIASLRFLLYILKYMEPCIKLYNTRLPG